MSRWDEIWYPSASARAPSLGARALTGLAAPYAVAVKCRNWMFDRGLLRAQTLSGLRVISVGNLNIGGTGKTPTVLWLAERALKRRQKVAVLSRGYGRARSDEVLV